jgi:rod shape-determining protein MreC
MRNLLNFLARYNNLIIFLLLEGLAIYLLSTGNAYHNTVVLKGIRGFTRGLEERVSNGRAYFSLREINLAMARENAALKNRIEQMAGKEDYVFIPVTDTIYRQKYVYSSATVINNSVNRQKNFYTINRGRRQGLTNDMAVSSGTGIAGVIVGLSDNYSVVMSVLNLDFRVSARIKSNDYFGSLTWDGRDPLYAILNEIPQHVPLSEGDTIETTGYSAVFPEGVMIGTISSYEKPGSDFYNIKVELATDFRKLRFVSVIGNKEKTEQVELEKLFQ